MKIEFDNAYLVELIERTVLSVLGKQENNAAKSSRLGYPEAEAACLFGVAKHSLRDCRLRGEIKASIIGRRVVYRADELKRFLLENEM